MKHLILFISFSLFYSIDFSQKINIVSQSIESDSSFYDIEKINKLYEQGNTIVYWTSRGSRKQINWYTLTKSQLDSWGVKYHELRVDKPYYDLFIDDKTLRIEEA